MTDFSGPNLTLGEWAQKIGHAIRQLRIEAGYDQIELAERANLSRSTVQSLEQGAGARLHTLLAALRALDRLDAFDGIMPEPEPTPLEVLAETRRSTTPQRRRRSTE